MNTLAILFSVFLSLLYSVSGYPATNYPEKEALRYGFQQTHECKSFEKSFLCVRKCLDKNYDVAVSDKNCKCTCYSKKDKAKYKQKNEHASTWVGGAPSTHLPRWYQTTGTNGQGAEDSGENTEYSVINEDGTSDTGGTAGPHETGEPGTGAAEEEHTGEKVQENEATGDTKAPEGTDHVEDKPAEETEGAETPAPEGETEEAPAAESEASEAPQEAETPAETEASPAQ